MYIELYFDDEQKDEEKKITLTNESFDVNGFVQLRIDDKEYSIHINDLYPAVKVFDLIYERENL